MAVTLGPTTKQIQTAAGGLRMTVTQVILDGEQIVHTVVHSEPYVEGELSVVTVKRFAGEMQHKIDAWLEKQRLAAPNAARDAFLPDLKSQLTLEGK